LAILAVALAAAAFVAMGQGPPDRSQDTWRVDDVFIRGEPTDSLFFGAVTAMAFGASGELAVLDGASSEVVVLNTVNGEVIRRFGRSGQGPGEFIRPTLITIRSSGEILVYDRVAGDRLSRFGADGRFLESTTLERSASIFVGMAATEAGLLLASSPRTQSRVIPRPSERARLTLTTDSGPGRRVWVWEEIESDPPLVRGEPRLLYSPAARWSLLPSGRIVVAQTDRSELRVLDLDGNVQQVMQRSVEPVSLTAEFKEFILGAQTNDENQIGIVFPEFYPLVQTLLPGPDGTILVGRSDGEGNLWELLSPEGEILAILDAPVDFRAMAARDGLVAGSQTMSDLETGVRVVRIQRPVRSRQQLPATRSQSSDVGTR